MSADPSTKPRCTAHTTTGRPCRRWPIRGGTVCPSHGGAAPQVRAAATRRLGEDPATSWPATTEAQPDPDPIDPGAAAAFALYGETQGAAVLAVAAAIRAADEAARAAGAEADERRAAVDLVAERLRGQIDLALFKAAGRRL